MQQRQQKKHTKKPELYVIVWNFSQAEKQAKEVRRVEEKINAVCVECGNFVDYTLGHYHYYYCYTAKWLVWNNSSRRSFLLLLLLLRLLLYVHCTWGEGYNFSHLPHIHKPAHCRHTHTRRIIIISSVFVLHLNQCFLRCHSKIFVMANGAHNNLLIYCHLTSCTNYIFAHENHLSITLVGIVTIFRFSLFPFPQANSNSSLSLSLFIWRWLFQMDVYKRHEERDMKNIYCDS